MLYKKHNDVSVIGMCIYIDNTDFLKEHDSATVFEYLFHIVRIISLNKKLFVNHANYDDFALFAAIKLYKRLTNPRQLVLDENGNPKLKRVKSILNYINIILNPCRIDFEQSEYYQYLSPEDARGYILYNLPSSLSNLNSPIAQYDINLLFNNISDICNQVLITLPYKKESSIYLNLLTSLKLTLLELLINIRKNKSLIRKLIKNTNIHENYLLSSVRNNNFKVKLFHLDNSYTDIVRVLCRKVIRSICNELKNTIAYDYLQVTPKQDLFLYNTEEEIHD